MVRKRVRSSLLFDCLHARLSLSECCWLVVLGCVLWLHASNFRRSGRISMMFRTSLWGQRVMVSARYARAQRTTVSSLLGPCVGCLIYICDLVQGALVHFSEDVVTNDTSACCDNYCYILISYFILYFSVSAITPWIALVQCDANATQASQEDDIFTLARDRGAVGAVSLLLAHPTLIV